MSFQFTSTRGGSHSFSAPEAIFQGLAPDGGLFVPTAFPQLGFDLDQLPTKKYGELTAHLLKQGLPGYSAETIDEVIQTGYAPEKFTDPLFVPIKSFGSRHFIELFHGPTLAFKDMALSLLPHLLVAARKQLSITKEAVILTATSGDTGSAALTGFADLPGTRILVFYPDQGISLVQKKQMVCQPGQNLFVCGVDGNFDQAQALVKSLFNDKSISFRIRKKSPIFLHSKLHEHRAADPTNGLLLPRLRTIGCSKNNLLRRPRKHCSSLRKFWKYSCRLVRKTSRSSRGEIHHCFQQKSRASRLF